MDSKIVRLIFDNAGTIGDTSFTVSGTPPTVTLGMTIESKPYKMVAQLMTPLISGLLLKCLETDMDAV